MGAATTPPEKPPPPASPASPGRLRVTGVVGALAAVCVAGSFFLPWVHIGPVRAQQFLDAVNRDLRAREEAQEPPPAGGEDFHALGLTMVRERGLKGVDLIRWVRAARTFSAQLDATDNRGVDADRHQRRLQLMRWLLYGIPIGALLLAAHFLFHRFRRARWPVLVLCILVGVAAVVLAATCQFTHSFLGQALHEGAPRSGMGGGWLLLLWGGAFLGLAGFFGVTARNWFRVYVASAATMTALGFLAYHYLESGRLL